MTPRREICNLSQRLCGNGRSPPLAQALGFRLALGSVGLRDLGVRFREHHRNRPRPRGATQPTLRSRNRPPRALKENRELAHGGKLSDSFRKIKSCHSVIFESALNVILPAATHLLITSCLTQSRHQSSTHASVSRDRRRVRFTPKSCRGCSCPSRPLWAMCGRLRVGKAFLTSAALVGAAMCSAFECGSHDRWP